jgi:hypothetical protein
MRMARKLIDACELSWIVIQTLREKSQFPEHIALAVVPDRRRGWRVVLPKETGRDTSLARFTKDIEVLEKKLRERYALTDE